MSITAGTDQAGGLYSLKPSKGRVQFCSRCGAIPGARERRTARDQAERVCDVCGMGVMLSTARGALLKAGSAFLVVTDDLRVTAVSQPAEVLIGQETSVLGANLLSLLSCPSGDSELAARTARAANGARDVVELPVTVEGAIGAAPFLARIASCGPPRGALLTVTPALTS